MVVVTALLKCNFIEVKMYFTGKFTALHFFRFRYVTVTVPLPSHYRPVTKKSRTLPIVTKASPTLRYTSLLTVKYRY